jgi:repressor LexA
MLTQRAKDTLNFISDYMKENGESPTIEQIAAGIGIKSVGSAYSYVERLEAAGKLKRLGGRSRGIRLIDMSDNIGSVVLPMKGKIAAGRLIEAVPDESEIDVGLMFAGTGRYVLKISGESMIGEGIMPGDYVVIDSKQSPKEGDIVVALVDGYEATLKTLLFNDDNTITLMPANPDFEPITLDADRVSIQGVVVGQMRKYA